MIIGLLVTFCKFSVSADGELQELRERRGALLSVDRRECDRLPPHPQANHRALGEAGNVRPRQTGRLEEALPRASAAAPLSEPLWPPTSTTLTVILG